MHVVDVLCTNETVQWGIYGRWTWIQIESRMWVHVHHFIFNRSLHSIRLSSPINRLKGNQLVLIERREIR